MLIKAITFDFGGTLVESHTDIDEFHIAIVPLLQSERRGVKLNDLKSAVDAALACLAETQSDGTEMTFEDVYRIVLDRLSIQAHDALIERIRTQFRTHCSTRYFPGVEKLLSSLSERYPLGLIGNSIHDIPKAILLEKGWDKYFTATVLSRDVGYRKPRPEIFNRALNILSVKGEEIIHVGDSLVADVAGALMVGATPVWVSHGRKSEWLGHTLTEVTELPSILKKM